MWLSAVTPLMAVSAEWHESWLSSRGALMNSSSTPISSVVQHQLGSNDVGLGNVDRVGNDVPDVTRLILRESIDRRHVSLLVQQQALVADLAIEMDRELGDAQDRPVDLHEPHCHFAALANRNPPRE